MQLHHLGEWKVTSYRRGKKQNSHVKTQVNTRWLIFSSSWSQKVQQVWCGTFFVLTDHWSKTSQGPLTIWKNRNCQAPKFPKSYHKDWKLQYHETGFHRRILLNIVHHQRTSKREYSTSSWSLTSEMGSQSVRHSVKISADRVPQISLTQVWVFTKLLPQICSKRWFYQL